MNQKKKFLLTSLICLCCIFAKEAVNAEKTSTGVTAGINQITSDTLKESLAKAEKSDAKVTSVKASNEEPVGKTMAVPYYAEYTGRKSFESCWKIKGYVPYDLQQIAITDEDGFRKVEDRYLVAVGTYWGLEPGQYFDIILENGTVINCIMGDQKNDTETDPKYHAYHINSRDCTEFIVDTNILPDPCWVMGDVSDLYEEWKSPVIELVVYEKFIELN